MSNYALGPWTTNELDWRVVQDAGGFVVADVRVPAADDGRLVAARISAAPDLYKAAKALLAARSLADMDCVRLFVRAAIAKAEGRA